MRDRSNPTIVFNLVMMMRQRSSRSVLLTEGMPDTDLYKKFVDLGACLVQETGDRDGVITLLARFDEFRMPAIGGIIDADADHFLGRINVQDNLFLTDQTDRETMLVDSAAFEIFCTDFNSTVPFDELRNRLYAAARPLGALRRISARDNWGVSFKEINHRTYIAAGPNCHHEKCCNEVVERNLGLVSEEMFYAAIGDEACANAPLTHIVSGHDLMTILSLRSSELFGADMSPRRIDFELSTRYGHMDFRATRLFGSLETWQARIPPRYKVF